MSTLTPESADEPTADYASTDEAWAPVLKPSAAYDFFSAFAVRGCGWRSASWGSSP